MLEITGNSNLHTVVIANVLMVRYFTYYGATVIAIAHGIWYNLDCAVDYTTLGQAA